MVIGKTSLGLDENIEGALCYLVWWITGLVFLLLERDNKFVKFHAMQSLITFLVITVIIWLFGWIPIFGWITAGVFFLIGFVFWLILMIKAYQGEKFKLPIVGDIAEKNS